MARGEEKSHHDAVMPVPTHMHSWTPPSWGNRWPDHALVEILETWVSSVNRSQETILGLAISKPQTALVCVFCRRRWLFSSWVFLSNRIRLIATFTQILMRCPWIQYTPTIFDPHFLFCWNCLFREEGFSFFSLFSLSLSLISKSWHVDGVWANLMSLLPLLRRTAEMLFNTSVSSLLQSVLIKIAQGSHLHIYRSTYPQIIPPLRRSWVCKTGRVVHWNFKLCKH